jgi:D-alanine-D-alanine ligase
MKKSLIVGLTYDLSSEYRLEEGDPEDMYGEFDSEETLERLEAAISHLGHSVRRIGNIEKLVSFLYQKQSVDIVFNIAEGRQGRSRESQVPALLDAYSIPYTFSDALTLGISLDKALTKRLFQQAGLPTSPFCIVENSAECDLVFDMGLEFPLFVKPNQEGSSKGIRLESVVETVEQLKVQVERVTKLYRQQALVEEFLPGREFTVAVIGSGKDARVLGVLEVTKVAVAKVNGFAQKNDWKTYGPIAFQPMRESPLRAQVAEISLRAYQLLECRDAGRVDLRMDRHGLPQLMEINALSGLSSHSALPIIAAHAGMSFEMLVDSIIWDAFARSQSILRDEKHVEYKYKSFRNTTGLSLHP